MKDLDKGLPLNVPEAAQALAHGARPLAACSATQKDPGEAVMSRQAKPATVSDDGIASIESDSASGSELESEGEETWLYQLMDDQCYTRGIFDTLEGAREAGAALKAKEGWQVASEFAPDWQVNRIPLNKAGDYGQVFDYVSDVPSPKQ